MSDTEGDGRVQRSEMEGPLEVHGMEMAGNASDAAPPPGGDALSGGENPVVVENRRQGSEGWRIGRDGHRVADDVSKQIKGFASITTIDERNTLRLYVSVNPAPQRYSIDVYRIGWYGGMGGRLMRHIGPLRGKRQPTARMDKRTGLIACPWTPSYDLWIPGNWTSGVYVAVLTNERGYQNYIVFVVRDDARAADFLYQQPVLNYQAYNRYPDDGRRGKSLYSNRSWGPHTTAGTRRAVKVSFDRPYHGHGAGEFFAWEVAFVHWVERAGYDIAYSTSIDTHARGARIERYRAWMTVGHDEYWTREQYDAVVAARDAGVHLAFFGANNVYWQVRLEPSAGGVPNRTLVCYKDGQLDPVTDRSRRTIKWRELGRPEQSLMGIQFTGILRVKDGGSPYTVVNASHWVYRGTGFRSGERVDGIVGPEADRRFPNVPSPRNTSYALLSRSTFVNTTGRRDHGNSCIYRAPSGAWVFNAGAWRWSWALDRRGYVDARIQRTTRNLLNRFLGSSSSSPVEISGGRGADDEGTVPGGPVFDEGWRGGDDDE